MRKFFGLFVALFLIGNVEAQHLPIVGVPGIRSGVSSGVVNPQIAWTQPTSSTSFSSSERNQFFAGTAIQGSSALTGVQVVCTGATTIDQAATGTTSWRYPAASTTLLSVGVTNCTITVTDAGARTARASKTITITDPDGTSPTVDAGADATTSAATYDRALECSDNVECVSVTWSGLGGTDVPCTLTGSGPLRTANCTFSLVATGGLTTQNIITVTGQDAAALTGSDQTVITRDVALAITTPTPLSPCTEDVSCSRTLDATGGTTGTYTFDNNGAGTSLNDADANCAGLTMASNGAISGTPNPASVPVTCSFTARVQDGLAIATKAFTLVIQSSTAERRHDYFEFQINRTDEGSASATSSGRPKCAADNTGTDCILQFDDGDDATYGDNGAIRFGEDRTAPITMTLAKAKQQIAGMQPSTPFDNNMGTKQNFTFGYDADTYVDKQLGAKVVLVGAVFGDGLCDQDAEHSGCSGLTKFENVEMTFPNINIGSGSSGTITFVLDDFFTDELNSNGINNINPDTGKVIGTEVVSDCPNGQLGTRNMRKQYRIDAVGKLIWGAMKQDFRQANADPYFLQDTDGYWDCDDGVVAVHYASGQNSITKSYDQMKVSPKTIGVQEYDGGANPNGFNAYALKTNVNDFPIFHSRWTRRIWHIEYGVAANSTKFDAWRDDCYQGDRISTPGSYVPGAAVDQSGVSGSKDNKCANMLKNDPATAGEAGNCPTKDTNLALCSIEDQDTNCRSIAEGGNPALCTSLWALVSTWVCDEVRGCERTAFRVPWWQLSPDTGTALALKHLQVEYDSSTSACKGCGDAIFYQGPVFGIVNIDPSDIDDTGCPLSCIGDTGALNNNLFRRPVRRVE